MSLLRLSGLDHLYKLFVYEKLKNVLLFGFYSKKSSSIRSLLISDRKLTNLWHASVVVLVKKRETVFK